MVVHITRRQPLGHQVVEPQHDADRDRLLVGVQEATTGHALGAVADHGIGRALVARAVETLLDRRGVKRDHRLHAHGQRLLGFLGTDAGLLGDERVHAIGSNHDAGAQFVLARTHADHLAALDHQLIDLDTGHHHDAGLLALLGQPCVELGAQHAHRVDRLGQALVPVVDVHRGGGVGEAHHIARDAPFHRGVVDEPGEHLLHHAAVEHATRQVLGTRLGGPLDEHHRMALLGQLVGGGATCHTATDHHDIKDVFVFVSHRYAFRASVSWGSTCSSSPTMP